MAKYLDQYRDEGLEPDPQFNLTNFVTQQKTRLAKEAALSWLVFEHPRRLGKNATPRELSLDKQFAKRYAYGAEELLGLWGANQKQVDQLVKAQITPENATIAAQIIWSEHIPNLCAILRHNLRYLATNITDQGLQKEANSAANNLVNELHSQAQRYEKVFGNPINPDTIPEIPQEIT